MMSEASNLKKKLNIEKHETIGGPDLPECRELTEEVNENSKKAATMVSAAHRQIIGGGKQKSAEAPTNCRRRRGAAGARL